MTTPFVKWTGGKRWLVAHHAHLLPTFPGRLLSTCLGGGAVELHLLPRAALLADAEPRLINAWTQVRDEPEALIAHLARLRETVPYTREAFEGVRAELNRGDALSLAARFLLVLYWGFNGLWRANGRGECNTPFGAPSKPGTVPPLGDPDRIRAASRVLQGAVILAQDFEATIAEAGPGDFIFADPPYDPLTATASFTGYGRGNWGSAGAGDQGALFGAAVHLDEQERLAAALRRASERGALVMTTNHATARIRRLYAGWEQIEVGVSRSGSCDGEGRGEAKELIVRSWRT